MPEYNVTLETLRKHRHVEGAIEDGIKLFEAGDIELIQDDSTYFRCKVPIPGKEHRSVSLTYTDDGGYVLPQYRGRGIGKALFAELARIAVKRGYGRFEWACLDWNEPSIGFYRSLGAVGLPEWTTYRLTGDALIKLAGVSNDICE